MSNTNSRNTRNSAVTPAASDLIDHSLNALSSARQYVNPLFPTPFPDDSGATADRYHSMIGIAVHLISELPHIDPESIVEVLHLGLADKLISLRPDHEHHDDEAEAWDGTTIQAA